MNQEIFETLGLSPNEAKIYQSLVETGESTISDIAVAAQIHRRNAYDAIRRLVEKGLVFQIITPTESHYNAVDPDKLTELLTEKQQQLRALIPELKKKFAHRAASEESYIYRGLEGQKNIFRDILRVKQDTYSLGAKGGWFDPKLEASRKPFFKEATRQKIKFINLFDFEAKGKIDGLIKEFPKNFEYRFLPKEYSTNSGVHIFGDYVVTYTGLSVEKISENVVFFVIKSSGLAESYRKWFQYIWSQSEK